jgi:hypothetical protein
MEGMKGGPEVGGNRNSFHFAKSQLFWGNCTGFHFAFGEVYDNAGGLNRLMPYAPLMLDLLCLR